MKDMSMELRTAETTKRHDPPFRGERASSHDELQAVRRIDWRFLLPSPDLDRVAFFGPAYGTLLDALRRFSPSVIEFGTGEADQLGRETFDVVVAQNPSRAGLAKAARLTTPRGTLYAEFSRPFLHPGRWTGLARQAGFQGVEVYWHWPNFEACTRIIPLSEAGMVVCAIVQKQARMRAAITATGVRWLHRTHLLGWGIRNFSLVAVRQVR